MQHLCVACPVSSALMQESDVLAHLESRGTGQQCSSQHARAAGRCALDVRCGLLRVKKRQISSQPTAQGVWKPTLDLEGRLQWLNGHPKAAGQRQQPQHARPPAAERSPPLAADPA